MMLTDDKMDQLLRKAGFGRCAVSAIGTGHYNNSYYVDSNRGRFVLRIAPSDETPKLFYEIGMMKSEVAIHRLVREHTDAPVPEIIYHDFSRRLIDRDYLIMEYLGGHSGAFDEKELGRYVQQIHAIESDEYGYLERAAPRGKSWPALFQSYVRLILDDCVTCGVMDRGQREQFLSTYDTYADAVVDVPPSLLHLDLWTQNILTVDGTITAILDFDRGLYGDPELEFAVLDTYGYSTPRFFEGYGKPRPVDAKAQIRQRLYVVYELIKYAFIRAARGGRMATGRSHVEQCARILKELE